MSVPHHHTNQFSRRALALAVFLVSIVSGAAWPQTPSAPPQSPEIPAATVPPGAAPPEGEQGDRFPALWEESQRLLSVYEKTGATNMALVDRLLKTKVCQSNRINGLIERTLAAMGEYYNASKKYYEVWEEAEVKRVEIQQKSLATMEIEKATLAGLLDDGKKQREQLEQSKAALEQSTRTEEIRRQIDELKQQILDSEDRLTKTQEKFDSLNFQITNSKAGLTKRLVEIRRYSSQLEEQRVEQAAVFEDKRKEGQEVCAKKQPSTPHTQKRNPNP